MWIYIGDKSYKGLKTYRCSNCCCMVHVELELPDECPNCGERNTEMKNMTVEQLIKKLIEERDHALATVESQQKKIDELTERLEKQRWIPCSERLPEDDVDVLISYRDKDEDYKGEDGYDGIAISHYGNVKFGGRLLSYKEWLAPWEYFHKGYDVIAWMPLPPAYKGE